MTGVKGLEAKVKLFGVIGVDAERNCFWSRLMRCGVTGSIAFSSEVVGKAGGEVGTDEAVLGMMGSLR